jgi:uncharacterized membrane protein (UPF0127 family)
MKKGIFLFICVFIPISCTRLETVEIKIKEEIFTVEVARSYEDKQKGLKYRDYLGEREGMLFVYDRDQELSFWMKDTKIPLSIAFLTKNGLVVQMEDMKPLSQSSIKSKYSVRYALEVKQGTFQELGLKVGDIIQLPDNL